MCETVGSENVLASIKYLFGTLDEKKSQINLNHDVKTIHMLSEEEEEEQTSRYCDFVHAAADERKIRATFFSYASKILKITNIMAQKVGIRFIDGPPPHLIRIDNLHDTLLEEL